MCMIDVYTGGFAIFFKGEWRIVCSGFDWRNFWGRESFGRYVPAEGNEKNAVGTIK